MCCISTPLLAKHWRESSAALQTLKLCQTTCNGHKSLHPKAGGVWAILPKVEVALLSGHYHFASHLQFAQRSRCFHSLPKQGCELGIVELRHEIQPLVLLRYLSINSSSCMVLNNADPGTALAFIACLLRICPCHLCYRIACTRQTSQK